MILGTPKNIIFSQYHIPSPMGNGWVLSETMTGRFTRILRNAEKEYFLTPILFFIQTVVFFCFFLGIMHMYKNKIKLFGSMTLVIISYFIITVGIVGYVRYRVVFAPLYCIVSGYGVSMILQKPKTKQECKEKKYENTFF